MAFVVTATGNLVQSPNANLVAFDSADDEDAYLDSVAAELEDIVTAVVC